MKDPLEVRESLLADLLDEAMVLLARVEALPAVLDESRASLLEAADRLKTSLRAAETDIEAFGTTARRRTAEYVMRAADDARRQVVEEQVTAIRLAARKVVELEVTPALKELADQLRHLARRSAGLWLVHVATAALVGFISSIAVAAVVLRWVSN